MWSTTRCVALIVLFLCVFTLDISNAASLIVSNKLRHGKTVEVNCMGGDLTDLVDRIINSGQRVSIDVPSDESVEGFRTAVCFGNSKTGRAFLFRSVDGDQEKCKFGCKVQVTHRGYARYNEEEKSWQPIPFISN